jgi:hypothetical protein
MDETGIVNAKAITPPMQVSPLFSDRGSGKKVSKGNPDPIAQITEDKSREFLKAESHAFEHPSSKQHYFHGRYQYTQANICPGHYQRLSVYETVAITSDTWFNSESDLLPDLELSPMPEERANNLLCIPL